MPEIDAEKLKKFVRENLIPFFLATTSLIVFLTSISLFIGERRKINNLKSQIFALRQRVTEKRTRLSNLKRNYRRELERIERMKTFFALGSLTDRPEEIVKSIYTASRKLSVDFDSFTSTLKDDYLTVDFSASGREEDVLKLLSEIFRTYPITVESLSLNKPKLKLYLRLRFKILMGKFPKAVSGA